MGRKEKRKLRNLGRAIFASADRTPEKGQNIRRHVVATHEKNKTDSWACCSFGAATNENSATPSMRNDCFH